MIHVGFDPDGNIIVPVLGPWAFVRHDRHSDLPFPATMDEGLLHMELRGPRFGPRGELGAIANRVVPADQAALVVWDREQEVWRRVGEDLETFFGERPGPISIPGRFDGFDDLGRPLVVRRGVLLRGRPLE